MKLSALMAQFRVDADDQKKPYLWSDESLILWANEAEQEACRRSALLKDSSTADICIVTAGTNNPWIKIDRRIVKTLRAKPQGYSMPVDLTTHARMDEFYCNWEASTGTSLRGLITDMETGKLRTFPILTADVLVNLTVWRLPLKDMKSPEDCPEIRMESHIRLIHWMLYKAYSVPDVDSNDPEKAKTHFDLFGLEFGKPASATHDEWMRQNGGRDLVTGSFL
jgi:hypothetical protein